MTSKRKRPLSVAHAVYIGAPCEEDGVFDEPLPTDTDDIEVPSELPTKQSDSQVQSHEKKFRSRSGHFSVKDG